MRKIFIAVAAVAVSVAASVSASAMVGVEEPVVLSVSDMAKSEAIVIVRGDGSMVVVLEEGDVVVAVP